MPVHLRPTAELAPRVLLPGDPGRALLLAQELLDAPRMFNHHRGLWGYTGIAPDGAPLTVQATGMGGPSAAIVVTELVELGARALVRVGTCGALAADLRVGDLVIADQALSLDGTSRALGAYAVVRPEARLVTAILAAAPQASVGPLASVDLFYGDLPEGAAGALAVEMEAATVFQVARSHGVQSACVCVVSDLVGGAGPEATRIGDDELEAAAVAAGRAALAALS